MEVIWSQITLLPETLEIETKGKEISMTRLFLDPQLQTIKSADLEEYDSLLKTQTKYSVSGIQERHILEQDQAFQIATS